MALTHNLLYPKQKAELERKLDPIKIGLLVGLVIVIALVLYWFVQGAAVDRLTNQRNQLQRTWEVLQPQLEAAQTQRTADEAKLATANALVSVVEDRFYFAPVLELILENIPNSAQVNRISMNYQPDNKTAFIQIGGKTAGSSDQRSRALADALRVRLLSKFREAYGPEVTLSMPTLTSAEPVSIRGKQFNTSDFLFSIEIPVTAEEAAPPPEGG
jgi:Tfp pilus assembly protein PilN